MTIPLGFEIGTGKPISVPLAHLAVTGITQAAGKTTTLEALISRSGLRALSFITKRAEGTFRDARQIKPYFKPEVDWRMVEAILTSTMGEKMKMERAWIMDACTGADTLQEVHANVKRSFEKARGGMNRSMLMTLDAYLQLVLPQIAAVEFSDRVEFGPGINVMDLSEMRLELQALVIRSALEWIYAKEQNTIAIIPEAWQFCPIRKGNPVKMAAEQLVRLGGASRNFLWLDSQDIGSVTHDILRSVSVWILGVQRDANEVKRTLEHIPGQKPKPADVMTLGIGEFFACFDKEVKRVYVQPAWVAAPIARAYAAGAIRDMGLLRRPA